MDITIEVNVESDLNQVWNCWVSPPDITAWNFANNDWCCPKAEIDLSVGGRFSYRMEAKDGSMCFDFEGEFVEIKLHKLIRYKLEDNREVIVEFVAFDGGVKVVETFNAEDESSAEQQRTGWLCILNNFKQHVERKISRN